jgi:hypothetical protein
MARRVQRGNGDRAGDGRVRGRVAMKRNALGDSGGRHDDWSWLCLKTGQKEKKIVHMMYPSRKEGGENLRKG